MPDDGRAVEVEVFDVRAEREADVGFDAVGAAGDGDRRSSP